jgi:hypothetical protein
MRCPLLLLLAALSALPAVAEPLRLPRPADRELFHAGHRRLPVTLPEAPVPLAAQDDVDVLSYDLSLWLDVPAQRIEGSVLTRFVAAPGTGGAPELVLDLFSNMTVTRVERGGVPLDPSAWSHAADLLTIALDPPAPEGGPPADVAVVYEGAPLELAFGTLTFAGHGSEPLVFSLSEPADGGPARTGPTTRRSCGWPSRPRTP